MDTFTALFIGNLCAVVTDADGIDPADILRIACETNAPETAFVLASDKADVRVRYFMPRGEIPFAGHPTIATGHFLRELGVLKPDTVRFEFAISVLPVDIRPNKVIMTQPPPSRTPAPTPGQRLTRSGFRLRISGKGFRASSHAG